jgi:uncharacterized protein (TIGR02118 family)
MTLLRRKPGATSKEFQRHWRDIHGALVVKLPHIQRYVQNFVLESIPKSEIEGIVELTFANKQDFAEAFASPGGKALPPDEVNFLSGKVACDGESRVLIADESGASVTKIISVLSFPQGFDGRAVWATWEKQILQRAKELRSLVGLTLHEVQSVTRAGTEEGGTDQIVAIMLYRLKEDSRSPADSAKLMGVIDKMEGVPENGRPNRLRYVVKERVVRESPAS